MNRRARIVIKATTTKNVGAKSGKEKIGEKNRSTNHNCSEEKYMYVVAPQRRSREQAHLFAQTFRRIMIKCVYMQFGRSQSRADTACTMHAVYEK